MLGDVPNPGVLKIPASVQGIQGGRLGLALPEGLSRDDWSRAVAEVAQAASRTSGCRDTLTAWLGDLLAYGGGKYRGQIKEYAEAAGMDPGSLRVAKLVCLRIPALRRRNGLSWSHHCEIAKSFSEWGDIERWMDWAERENWSRNALRKAIRREVAGDRADEAENAETSPFALLRELRCAVRAVRIHDGIWTQWTSKVCRQALAELGPVRQMLGELERKAK